MPFSYRFAANVSTMFDGDDFPARFRRAKELGFDTVEAQSLYHVDLNDLIAVKKETGLAVALINSPKNGDVDYFEGQGFGLACIPGQELQFAKSVLNAIKYAHALDCKRIHILAGLKQDGFCEEDLFRTYRQNMEYTADILEEHNIVGLIEPICPQVKELYILNSFDKAMNVISEIDSSHLQLLLDVYHLQMLEGNVEEGIKKYLKYAGHVQISQAPGREEPFYPGKIDYEKVLGMLVEMKYDGHIGLEYTPSDPEKGFKWLENYRAT